jgi:hypothetical protein
MTAEPAVAQRKSGPPLIPLDLAKVEALAARGCSEAEIAAELGVSEDTIQRRKHKTKFARAMAHGRAKGRVRLRSAQYETAINGNATMQIWLGKQPGPCGLGQIDTSYSHISGAITVEHDIAARLAAGRERLQASESPAIDVVAAEDQ